MEKLIAILFMLPLTSWGTTLTIEIPDADVPRVAEAFGQNLNLGHPAKQDELQKAILDWLNATTYRYERKKFNPVPLGVIKLTPTPTATPKKKK